MAFNHLLRFLGFATGSTMAIVALETFRDIGLSPDEAFRATLARGGRPLGRSLCPLTGALPTRETHDPKERVALPSGRNLSAPQRGQLGLTLSPSAPLPLCPSAPEHTSSQRTRHRHGRDQALAKTAGTLARRQLRRDKLANNVAQSLLRDIRRRGLSAGDQLPKEADMLVEYGVGRGTLREALRVLETCGLIAVKSGPGGGPLVQRHS